MSKGFPFLKLDFEKNFTEELAEITTTLERDFSQHSTLMAQRAGESTARLTKQLNELQFINEEKHATLRSLGKELERTESGLLAMGHFSVSESSTPNKGKLEELQEELGQLITDKSLEVFTTSQLKSMNKAMRRSFIEHKHNYELLQAKFERLDQHSESLEIARQAGLNTLHESIFQFNQAKQHLQDHSRQRLEMLKLKRSDLEVLKGENSALTERLTSLTMTANRRNKQRHRTLQTLKATVDGKTRCTLERREVMARKAKLIDAFGIVTEAARRFECAVDSEEARVPAGSIARALIELQKQNESLQQSYFSMAEGKQSLLAQFHKLSLQLKAECQKDLIDDLKQQEQHLLDKVSRLTDSAHTCNQVLSSLDSFKPSSELSVESAEKLIVALMFSLVFLIFRASTAVTHLARLTKADLLEPIKHLGQTKLKEIVGIVMSDVNLSSEALLVIKAANLKLSCPDSFSDCKLLEKQLLNVLHSPDLAAVLAQLIMSTPLLKSFIVKPDLSQLKAHKHTSTEQFTNEIVGLVHRRIKDKYASGASGFIEMTKALAALTTSESEAFASGEVSENVKVKALQKLALQTNSAPRVVDSTSIVRLAVSFSLEKMQFRSINEKLKNEFENYISRYKVVAHKHYAKDPLKRRVNKITPVLRSLHETFMEETKSPRQEKQSGKASTAKLPKYLDPLDRSPKDFLDEARSFKFDIDSIKRKERVVKKSPSIGTTLKSPRKLEPLSRRA
jgi:hypothetical protein